MPHREPSEQTSGHLKVVVGAIVVAKVGTVGTCSGGISTVKILAFASRRSRAQKSSLSSLSLRSSDGSLTIGSINQVESSTSWRIVCISDCICSRCGCIFIVFSKANGEKSAANNNLWWDGCLKSD